MAPVERSLAKQSMDISTIWTSEKAIETSTSLHRNRQSTFRKNKINVFIIPYFSLRMVSSWNEEV